MTEFSIGLLNFTIGEVNFGLRGEHIEIIPDDPNEERLEGYQIVLGLIFLEISIVIIHGNGDQ